MVDRTRSTAGTHERTVSTPITPSDHFQAILLQLANQLRAPEELSKVTPALKSQIDALAEIILLTNKSQNNPAGFQSRSSSTTNNSLIGEAPNKLAVPRATYMGIINDEQYAENTFTPKDGDAIKILEKFNNGTQIINRLPDGKENNTTVENGNRWNSLKWKLRNEYNSPAYIPLW
jgi:hypothetical protein